MLLLAPMEPADATQSRGAGGEQGQGAGLRYREVSVTDEIRESDSRIRAEKAQDDQCDPNQLAVYHASVSQCGIEVLGATETSPPRKEHESCRIAQGQVEPIDAHYLGKVIRTRLIDFPTPERVSKAMRVCPSVTP